MVSDGVVEARPEGELLGIDRTWKMSGNRVAPSWLSVVLPLAFPSKSWRPRVTSEIRALIHR